MPNRSINGWVQWCPALMAMPSESSMVPMSWGWTPSITKERMLALLAAVPMSLTLLMLDSRSVPYYSRLSSWALVMSMPRPVT